MNLNKMIEDENIEVPDDFFYNIQKYKEQLFKWNKIHNLTGAKTEQIVDEFIFDSLYPVTFLPKVSNLLDIGTGAGFPGMILALGLPDTQVTLVEPLTKKASFLQFIKADLGLKNVTVVKKRVEDMPSKIFELITSRAVTDTKMLLKLSENFRDANSKLLFYKGEKVYDEIPPSTMEDVHAMKYKIIQTKNRHYLILGEE
jgi:16S rRNA (guanine527-N7)-methyltransferase